LGNKCQATGAKALASHRQNDRGRTKKVFNKSLTSRYLNCRRSFLFTLIIYHNKPFFARLKMPPAFGGGHFR